MADNFILIDGNTSFNGKITAREVIVEGEVNGDVTASDKVLIKNEAVVNGDIITDRLLFEEGAQHNGMIRLGQPKAEDLTSEKQEEINLPESDNPKKGKDKAPAKKSEEEKNLKRLW